MPRNKWDLLELEFQKIKLDKGDTLAVTIPHRCDGAERENIMEALRKVFPDNKAIFVAEDIKLSAIKGEINE